MLFFLATSNSRPKSSDSSNVFYLTTHTLVYDFSAMDRLWVCVLCLAFACASEPNRRVEQGVDADVDASKADDDVTTSMPTTTVTPPVQEEGCKKMDILFVIDNSASMREEQDNLATNFPRFIDVLNTFKDGAIDYRVGVVATGGKQEGTGFLGVNTIHHSATGALLQPSDCGMSNPWLQRGDDDLDNKFACLAQVGTKGSNFEMPMRAINLATTERVSDGTNVDFFREDALLAVVILTDENDCSSNRETIEIKAFDFSRNDFCGENLLAPEETLAALDELKGEREKWALAVIAGTENPTCSSEGLGSAGYSERLIDLAEKTGENAVVDSICQGDLATPLQGAMENFGVACEQLLLL